MNLTRLLLLLALLLIGTLAGCGTGLVAEDTPPSSIPSAAPSAPPAPIAPAEPSVPTQASETPPPQEVRLPAPLYFLDQGQIVRLETDGATQTTISHEEGRVVAFDIAASTGALGYLVEPVAGDEPRTLVYAAADGSQRRELFSGALRSPVFIADDESIRDLDPASSGNQIAYRVAEPLPDVPPERAGPGLFVSGDLGMCPYILHPEDPAQSRHSEPLAPSPDGERLLLRVLHGEEQGATLAILQPDGSLTEPVDHQETPFSCCEAAWSDDGSTVYAGTDAGLFRIDAASGAADMLFAATDEGNASEESAGVGGAVIAPHPLPDGSVAFFLTHPDTPSTTLYRLAPEGSTPRERRRTISLEVVRGHVAWAEQGRGVVVQARAAGENVPRLFWLSADGDQLVTLPVVGAEGGDNLRWLPVAIGEARSTMREASGAAHFPVTAYGIIDR